MTELKPCPRCMCPFVEYRPSSWVGQTGAMPTFVCYGCQLTIYLGAKPAANEVELWNAWPRTSSTDAMATAARAQADAMRANNATRLERLVVALVRSLSGDRLEGPPDFSDAAARAIVVFASSLDEHLARMEFSKAHSP